jgi:hypothetical protein
MNASKCSVTASARRDRKSLTSPRSRPPGAATSARAPTGRGSGPARARSRRCARAIASRSLADVEELVVANDPVRVDATGKLNLNKAGVRGIVLCVRADRGAEELAQQAQPEGDVVSGREVEPDFVTDRRPGRRTSMRHRRRARARPAQRSTPVRSRHRGEARCSAREEAARRGGSPETERTRSRPPSPDREPRGSAPWTALSPTSPAAFRAADIR